MSEPVKVLAQRGEVGLQIGGSFKRFYWFSPLDALDLAEEIRVVAEQTGAEAVEAARAERKQSA